MKRAVLLMTVLMAASCKNSEAKVSTDGGAPASAAITPSETSPETAKKPAISGRCENETTNTPYGSLYFYPDTEELFITVGESATRIPIAVKTTESDKIRFLYKWENSGEKFPTTGDATIARVGTKWNFNFESIKDIICHPMKDDLFYKKLPEVGIAAGKYLDLKSNNTLTVVAWSQKLLRVDNGDALAIWYYRVRSKSEDAGVKIFTTSEIPTVSTSHTATSPQGSDSTSVAWGSSSISKIGEDILVSFNGKLTRTYSPVK